MGSEGKLNIDCFHKMVVYLIIVKLIVIIDFVIKFVSQISIVSIEWEGRWFIIRIDNLLDLSI